MRGKPSDDPLPLPARSKSISAPGRCRGRLHRLWFEYRLLVVLNGWKPRRDQPNVQPSPLCANVTPSPCHLVVADVLAEKATVARDSFMNKGSAQLVHRDYEVSRAQVPVELDRYSAANHAGYDRARRVTIDPPYLWHLRDVVNHLEKPRILRQVEGAYEAVVVEVDIDAWEGRYGIQSKRASGFRRAGTDIRIC
jgi:hypothetical protein